MLNDLLIKNRSVRSYKVTDIPYSDLEYFVEQTRLCASAQNLQPLKYIIANGGNLSKTVFENVAWAGYLPKGTTPEKGKEAQNYIVICADTAINQNEVAYSIDAGIAAQTVLLSAVEKGYNGCILKSFKTNKLATDLKLSDNILPVLVISIGVSDEICKIEDYKDSIKYYRKNGEHIVPKRLLNDIIIK